MEPAVEAVTDDRAYNHSAELVPELGMAAHRVNKNSQEDQVSAFSLVRTTLQFTMNVKLSKQRFWNCHENGLIKTSLYCGLRIILVYPNPQ